MKILTIDIECAPNLAYVWGLFKQNISIGQIEQPGEVISFAALWTDDPRVIFRSNFHDGHEAMIKEAWNLLNEADAVVSYNGQMFDMPHLNREFLLAGLTAPSPYKNIDLYLIVRKQFKFLSNKLDYVAQALDLGGKTGHTGFQLWLDCMAGDAEAWRLMKTYNIQDILLTEKLYYRIRPWIGNHPSTGLYDGSEHSCPNCGSTNLTRRGYAYTTVSKFQRYVCECGKWSRGNKRLDAVSTRNAT